MQNDIAQKLLYNILTDETTITTLTISDAICMYNDKYACSEKILRILITFNPIRTTAKDAHETTQRIANTMCTVFKQSVIPGYRYLATSIVGKAT